MNKNQLKTFIILSISVVLLNCKSSPSEPVLFEKLSSSETNINFENTLSEDDSLNILDYLYYYNGGGVAAGDINNDGLTDLFFVSNRGENKLYLNKSDFKFDDISEKAQIKGKSNWKTGVSMVDINADGWLDIYVCAVGNYKGLQGTNELFINNKNGTFTEKSKEYGLDFKGFATQATFFDYDKDGDLDCYILTHAVHSVSSYDRVSARALRDGEAGDYLLRNETLKFPSGISLAPPSGAGGAVFVDVSREAGIYGAAMGYGLGIVTADINNDGWEDIYVSNDFHEDDYYYINQKNGTFKEAVKENFKHLSKYSMGCDVADVNNDGYLDIFTADMHPQDEITEKLSLGEDAYDIYQYKLQFGFYNQYSRNCLQISNKGKAFQDISPMAGVSSTDWSWSPLLADYDNDGVKDLFITNGIPHRPNNMDYIKFLSSKIDSTVLKGIPTFGQKVDDKKALDEMPKGDVPNYIYKGTDGWKFEDKSKNWGFFEKTISNGAVYADLDNDGDLDLITNDINAKAGIYRNNQPKENNNFLKIKLTSKTQNSQGIGTKVFVKIGEKIQTLQQQPIRGFMSSVEPILHFGLGKNTNIDSVFVIWSNGKMEVKSKVKSNQTLVFQQENANLDASTFRFDFSPKEIFTEIPNLITAKHTENDFIDFIREPLIPFLASTEGPKIAVGDVNNDGLEDLYQCGSRDKNRSLLLQKPNGSFQESTQKAFGEDKIYEDTDALFFDADNDKDLDLYVVSGGNEYLQSMDESRDRLYLNDGKGNFTKKKENLLSGENDNKSCVKPADFDKDGDIDLFVGGRSVSFRYGETPKSMLLQNNGKGVFTEIINPELQKAGLVTDAVWSDVNKDGWQDLVVVGEWMGIKTFINEKGKLKQTKNELTEKVGFWHAIVANDFDGDGDEDFIIGNLGTNTKFIRDPNPKMRMFANDMDGNGYLEQLIAYNRGSEWYPAASRDDLSRMAPGLINARFPKYTDYAGKTMERLFNKKELAGKEAIMYEVNTFESIYAENLGNGKFSIKPLPKEAQTSKIYAIKAIDIDGDNRTEVLLGGNLYGVSTYQGRYDANYGTVLKFTKNGFVNLPFTGFNLDGQVRDIKSVKTKTGSVLVVARNNMQPQVFVVGSR